MSSEVEAPSSPHATPAAPEAAASALAPRPPTRPPRGRDRTMLVALLVLLAFAAGAGAAVYWPRSPDPLRAPPRAFRWTVLPEPWFPVPPHARFLRDVRIVVDPGHGGRGDEDGRGPTGLREADVNLEVARRLRELLVAAGASVVLTREDDVFLAPERGADLAARIRLANDRRAALFLSLHHNAAADPSRNFTTVFHHGTADHSPASLAAGRHVLVGLRQALRLEQETPTGLVSDLELSTDGFQVLREAEVPAILVEASFHTNPAEEARLRSALYNRREAYGIFLGLVEWAASGFPHVSLAEPRSGRVPADGHVVLRVDDGLVRRGGFGTRVSRLREASLAVRVDGAALPHVLDRERGLVTVDLREHLVPGLLRLRVDFENVLGASPTSPWIELLVPDASDSP